MTESLSLPYQRHVLGNGLTVLLHRDPKVPHVAVNVWYLVGSKNERPGSTGLAHLSEHLMFEGSLHHDDEYFAPLEDVGATQINATTSRDRTNYFQTVPVHALDTALWLESDRMGFFLEALTEAKLEEQRSVVLNEMRQGYNQPYGRTWKVIAEATYPDAHPYSWPVIGRREDVEAVSLADAQAWFRSYYGPSNAVLTLAGDLDFDDALARVERWFGSIGGGEPVLDPGPWTAERTEPLRVRMQDRVPQARLACVWNLPGITDRDYLPLHYFASVLSSGRSSVLFRRLVHEDQLATRVAAQLRPGVVASNLVIQADARPEVDLDRLHAAIIEELRKAATGGADPKQLERAQTQVRAGMLRQLQRVGGLSGKANMLASGQAFFNQPDAVIDQFNEGLALTIDDINRALKRWVVDTDGNPRGALRLDVEPFGRHAPAEDAVDRTRAPTPTEPRPPRRPDIDRRDLAAGGDLLHVHRPGLPLVRLEINLPGGFAADSGAIPGTARLTASALAEGTERYDSFAISDAIRSLGARLSVSAHLDGTTLALTALEEGLDATLELASELVASATFPEAEIARLREEFRAEIAQEQASPGHLAQRILPRLLFGTGHPYSTSFTGLGSAADLDAIDRDLLDAHRRRWYLGRRARVAAAGSLTADELLPKLEAILTNWPASKFESLSVDANPLAEPGIHFIERPGSEQTLLFAGLLAPPIDARRDPHLDVFNAAFGGSFTSRINTNLREDKAWTYGAHSTVVPTRGLRPFLMYTEVDQEHTLESIEELERELTEVTEAHPIDAREVDRTRDNLLLSLPAEWETLAGATNVMSDLLTYDQPISSLDTYVDELRAASAESVAAAVEGWIDPAKLVWVVVADASVGKAIEAQRGLRDRPPAQP